MTGTMTEEKVIRVQCPACEAFSFKTEFCECGKRLVDEPDSTIEERLRTSTINLPTEATDIIHQWLNAYFSANGDLPETHCILMELLGLGTYDKEN